MLSPDFRQEPAKKTAPPAAEPGEARLISLRIVSLKQPKLNLGRIVITSNAHAILSADEVRLALRRHQFGDWGTVCAEDWKTNDQRARDQGMVLSAYESAAGTAFWVISDPGHEITTVLMPEDY
jgi:hypothetical protein